MIKDARKDLEDKVKKLLEIEGFSTEAKSLSNAIRVFISVIDKKSGSDGTQELKNFAAKLEQKLLNPDEVIKLEKVGNNLTYIQRYNLLLSILNELESATILKGQPRLQPKAQRSSLDKGGFVLKKYPVPSYIYDALKEGCYGKLGLNLTVGPKNYVDQFERCLWIEEAYQALELLKYNLDSIKLTLAGAYFQVKVPGLSEGRPSVMIGDILLLKELKSGQYYEGNVHHIGEQHVLIKCNDKLHDRKDSITQSFSVTFRPSRGSLRWHHYALNCYNTNPALKDIVFPDPIKTGRACHMIKVKESNNGKQGEIKCFRSNLSSCQRTAVINVLRAVSRPAPYIIFGPPGTGKTITIVEAILQIYSRKPDSRILVCGNSNSCADLLARHILESRIVARDKFIRLIAYNRQDFIPPQLQRVTKTVEQISKNTLPKLRIIIATCCQAGSLNFYKESGFDYVFIDEAGHASEPETLLPLNLLKKNGCAVLAGDPHQLGPFCLFAENSGTVLGTSLLEALTTLPMYSKRMNANGRSSYDERYITKLIVSFRSDPRLTIVNNQLFYDSELEFKNQTPEKWMKVFKLKHPLVYRPVKGRERKMKNSPSCWNPEELFACLWYVKRLYWRGLRREQLGIITPYRLQIRQLNIWFDRFNIPKCKIDTIEAFQGEEREVMIISTVRSYNSKLSDDNICEKMQFLFQPKRFNVATSRAKWLNILIGDPRILELNSNWSEYMKAAEKHELWKRRK